MTLDEVMQELESKATESTKKTLLRHGALEPLFGVKVGDLKPLQKKLKNKQALALELYDTRNSDAMYLAGLIADGSKMTRKQLDHWAATATWHMIAEYTVPWVASEHPDGAVIADQWLESKTSLVAAAGWATWSALASTRPDEELPMDRIEELLKRVQATIHSVPDRVRYTMNAFVICVGTYVAPLAECAMNVAQAIGKVEVSMGKTACKVPHAPDYITKSRRGQNVAPKRKTARC